MFLFLQEKKNLVKLSIFPLFYNPGSGSTDTNECGSNWIRIHIPGKNDMNCYVTGVYIFFWCLLLIYKFGKVYTSWKFLNELYTLFMTFLVDSPAPSNLHSFLRLPSLTDIQVLYVKVIWNYFCSLFLGDPPTEPNQLCWQYYP